MANSSKQRIAVYPGSFDPITLGHIDILQRALRLFDKVIVVVAKNREKEPLFSLDERVSLIKKAIGEAKLENVFVEVFSGLLVDYVKTTKARHMIRGLRAVSDFDYEFQIATINREMAPNIDSVFLMTDREYFYLSSSMIKDLARHGVDLSKFVPTCVEKALEKKYGKH